MPKYKQMSEIHNCSLAFQHLKPYFNSCVEEFWLMSLSPGLNLKDLSLINRGTINYCQVHPRDVFRHAISQNAYAIIIAHNHPSGQVEPSLEDIKLTKKLVKVSKLLEVPILDHIIFTDSKFFSFKQKQLISRK